MMRTILAPAVLAGLLALATTSPVHAYGACHRTAHLHQPLHGQIRDGPRVHGGRPQRHVYHSASVSGSGRNGAYHTSDVHAYSPTMYHGYSGAGVDHGYDAAVVRYP